MGSSYSLFTMSRFPEIDIDQPIEPPSQKILSEEFIEDPPRTVFEYKRRIAEHNIQVYLCTHEIKVNQQGRAQGIAFPYYIGKHTFSSYYAEDQRLMLVKTRKLIAHHAMRALTRDHRVEIEKQGIDLMSIKDLIQGLKGAYITVDNSPDINALAYWGSNVDGDIRFEQALQEGRMYHVRLDYDYNGTFFHIGVSEDRGIVLYDSNLDEYNELDLVLDIKKRIVDKARPKI